MFLVNRSYQDGTPKGPFQSCRALYWAAVREHELRSLAATQLRDSMIARVWVAVGEAVFSASPCSTLPHGVEKEVRIYVSRVQGLGFPLNGGEPQYRYQHARIVCIWPPNSTPKLGNPPQYIAIIIR